MEYSWKYGELTSGFEWCEYIPDIERERIEKKARSNSRNSSRGKRHGEGKAAVTLAMLFAVISSYAAGGIISADDLGVDADALTAKNDAIYEDAIPVMSGGVVSDMDYTSVSSAEKEARISELATAYIEEYMSEKYGEGEN